MSRPWLDRIGLTQTGGYLVEFEITKQMEKRPVEEYSRHRPAHRRGLWISL